MGCDIHLWAEAKNGKGWHVVDGAAVHNRGPANEFEKDYGVCVYDERNYDLFGMLANVRNGRGFAGSDTGDGFEPILIALGHQEVTRGVPHDASSKFKQEVREWDGDGHSHSYLTLAELLAYPRWDAKSILHGVVTPSEFVTFVATGRPKSWSGGVMGNSVKVVTNDEMTHLLAQSIVSKDDDGMFTRRSGENALSYYTQVAWSESYAECAGEFYTTTIPALRSYAERERLSHNDLRVVFFFDN